MLWPTYCLGPAVVVASLAFGLVGCANRTPDSDADVQLEIFAAAVRGVMSLADWTVKIDPRPIDVIFGPVIPDAEDYLPIEPAVMQARDSVIRDLGASTGTAFPLRPRCPGVFGLSSDTSGCPSEREQIFVFGAEAEIREDEWVLPMISILYDPGAKSGGTYEAIVIWRDGGWVLDRRVKLIALD